MVFSVPAGPDKATVAGLDGLGDKYRIIRELGRGGMGVVYLAEDINLGREVAVKMMRPGLSLDSKAFERFRREARAVARLAHPHIVYIHAFDMVHGQLLLEMPYLPGGSLQERMARGVTPGTLAHILDQSLHALACCHAAGVIHRDVKPGNLLFNEAGAVMLSDFGAAALAHGDWEENLARGKSTVLFIGTPQYACPEAWNGEPPAPHWDLFSLGMIAREIVMGELPFSDASPLVCIRRMASEPMPPMVPADHNISPPLAALINGLTAFDVKERLHDANEALARLRDTPEHAQSPASSTPTVTSRQRPFKPKGPRRPRKGPRRMLRVIGMTAVAVCCAAGGLLLLPRSPAPAENAPARQEAIKAMSQRAAFAKRLPTAEELLALNRVPGTALYTWTTNAAPGALGRALLAPAAHDGEFYVTGHLTNLLWSGSLREGEGEKAAVEGWWAIYAAPGGHAPRFGWMEGEAHWAAGPGEAFQVHVFLQSETDPDAWHETLFFTPEAQPGATDTAFIHDLEASPRLMPLLFNEVLPRDIENRILLHHLLPAVHDARTLAAPLPGGSSPVLDGRIVENRYTEGADPLPGRPGARNPRLWAHTDAEALYLGLHAEDTALEQAEVTLALLPRYRVPQAESNYLLLTLSERGLEAAWFDGNGEVTPLNGLGEGAMSREGDVWSAEARLVYDRIPGVGAPQRDTVYRLNAALHAPGDPDNPVAAWGWPKVTEPAHGALLFFNPARVEPRR